MPYPRVHTLWRVSSMQLAICWMYGRVITRDSLGEIGQVRLTLNHRGRVRDYVSTHSSKTIRYFETYQTAVKFLQECILDEGVALSKLWKTAKQQEHGRGITKAERI